MKISFLSFLFFFAMVFNLYSQPCPTCAYVSGPSDPWDITSLADSTQKAWLYKPDGFDTSKRYPLIIFLHGKGPYDVSTNGTPNGIAKLLNEGLVQVIQNGQKMKVLVVAPQLRTSADNWSNDRPYYMLQWMKRHYKIDTTKCYITGLSLGAQGTMWAMRKNYGRWAAAIPCSGAGVTFGDDSRVNTTPAIFLGGDSDIIQPFYTSNILANPSRTESAWTSYMNNSASPSPVIPVQLYCFEGGSHSFTIWNNQLYNKSTASFNFEDWFLNFSLNADSTATRQTELLEKYIDSADYDRALFQYPIAKKYTDGLAFSATKASLTTRYSTAKSKIDNQGKRYIVKFGTGFTDPFYNSLASGATNAAVSSLKDHLAGTASSYQFKVTAAANSGTTEFVSNVGYAPYALNHTYYGFTKGFIQNGFTVSGTTGIYAFNNLNPAKKYRVLVFGSFDSLKIAQRAKLTIVIGDTAKYILTPFNTNGYIEFSGLTPTGGGTISFAVKGAPTITNPALVTKLKTGASRTLATNISSYGAYNSYINGVMLIESKDSVIPTKYINVNVCGTLLYNRPAWNDWQVGTGTNTVSNNDTSGIFHYENGETSTVSAVLSYSKGVNDWGTGYPGIPQTLAPDTVLRSASNSTSLTRTITVRGLNAAKTYAIELYASHKVATGVDTANRTIFSIGAAADTIITGNNTTDKAVFTGLHADSTGKIIITSKRYSTWTYLNGFRITESSGGSGARVAAPPVIAVAKETNKVLAGNKFVEIYPNPANDQFMLQLNNPYKGSLKVSIVDMGGRAQKHFSFIKDQDIFRKNIGLNGMASGSYLVEIQVGNWKTVKAIVKQ